MKAEIEVSAGKFRKIPQLGKLFLVQGLAQVKILLKGLKSGIVLKNFVFHWAHLLFVKYTTVFEN